MTDQTITNKSIEMVNALSKLTTKISHAEWKFRQFEKELEDTEQFWSEGKISEKNYKTFIESFTKKMKEGKRELESLIEEWNQLLRNSVLTTPEMKG